MANLKTVVKIAKNPSSTIRILGSKGVFNWLPDKPYLKLLYRAETGRKLNLENPKTFNEKLQWLKINRKIPEYQVYVDKYEVRKYVSEILGEGYLIPLIAVYKTVEEIDWEKLPDKFVLKCNHGSGANIICRAKEHLNYDKAKRKLKQWLRRNYYWFGREWPYKYIEKKIVVEELLEEGETGDLHDYKFWVFNGKVKFINVHFHESGKTKINIYDRSWNLQKFGMVYDNDLNIHHEKPKNLDRMIEDAERIALDISSEFLRVDFYNVDGKIYFGEITFYPTSGFIRFFPCHDKLDKMYGEMLELNIPQ